MRSTASQPGQPLPGFRAGDDPDSLIKPHPVSAFGIYFMMLAAVLSGTLMLGYINDEAGYVAEITEAFSTHLSHPFMESNNPGHPMLYAWMVAVLWKIFGISRPVSYLFIWFWAALALVGVQVLTQLLCAATNARRAWWAGPLAALCLFATPMFISNAGQYLDPIPCLAFSLLAVICWRQGRRGWLTFWLILLTMSRLTACLSVLGLGLFDIARALWRPPNRSVKKLARVLVPYLVTGAVLSIFLIIKIWIFKLPLSGYVNQTNHIMSAAQWLKQGRVVYQSFVYHPAFCVAFFFWPIFLVLLALPIIRLVGEARHTAPHAAPDSLIEPHATTASAVSTYSAMLAFVLPVLAFHSYLANYPLPRYFLTQYVFLVIAGVHAWVWLMRSWRPLAVAVLLAWLSFQGYRWEHDWLKGIYPRPGQYSRAAIMRTGLEPFLVKRLFHDFADYVTDSSTRPALLLNYPVSNVFRTPLNGFVNYLPEFRVSDWFKNFDDAPAWIGQVPPAYDHVYLIDCSYDVPVSRGFVDRVRQRHPKSRLIRTWMFDGKPCLRIYCTTADAGEISPR